MTVTTAERTTPKRIRTPKPTAKTTSDAMLRHDEITPNPDQPRKLFDQKGLEELAASISQYGILQPIVVRPTKKGYMIIAGERRWRAAGIAELSEVPCRILSGLSDVEAFILSVTENVARRDMTIIEEANSYAAIVSLGKTPTEVGKIFGKNGGDITMRLSLLNLRDDLQELAARGQLPKDLAWSISRLSLAGQARFVTKYMSGAFQNDTQARAYSAVLFEEEASPEMFAPVQDALEIEAARQVRQRVTNAWDKLGRSDIAKILDSFLEQSPEQLAAALGPDCRMYEERFTAIGRQVAKVQRLMCQGAARHLAESESSCTSDTDTRAL